MGSVNHPIVGRVTYGVSGTKLILDSDWVSQNIGTVHIPQLKGVPTYGGRFSGNVRFYKRAIPQLVAAFEEVERARLLDKILFWDGSFVPRLKRGGSTPSNHTFGTAFDINAEWNPFRRRPAAPGAKGDLHAIAQIFKRFGFEWGGDWRNTPDGMHLEVARILSPQELAILTQNHSAYPANVNTPAIPIPTYDGPAFEIIVNNTGKNIGPGLIYNGDIYGPLRAFSNEIGKDIVKSGDQRAREEQPRFYVLIGEKKAK